ncbi:ABC transporter ATP-binding protein [Microcella sp.]|uniref:ABC transporter ATP-binding protein n=1 Tax=Microcella sp. TaxID=1913979 RepID=UPI0039192432
MTPVLEATALTKRYGRRTALHGVDLQVEPGRIVGLIGPNGAGKTTTMRILLDIIRPTSGTVRVLGHDPRVGGPALRRRIGYLPGELIMDARLCARGLLTHYAALNGDAHAAPRIAELADRLGLDLSRPVSSLSKGNKQKVGLVQAFAHRPDVLILDEPTSGLDPLVQQQFLGLVREATTHGQTVLLSSHVISEIDQAADDVVILRDGRIVSVSSVADLRAAAERDVRVTVDAAESAALTERLARIPSLGELRSVTAGDRVTISGRLADGLDDLLAALTHSHVRDLVIAEPDLERVVLGFYGDHADNDGADQ